MVRYYLGLISLTLVFCSSCENWIMPPDPEPSPSEVFDHLWKDVGERYAFFDHKALDWEVVGAQYRPKIREDMGQVELFELLAEVLFELKDGHVNLTNSFNRSRNWHWFEGFPTNYNENLIQEHYLGADFWISGPLRHQILGEVLYVNYGSFAQTISTGNIQAMIARSQGKKGLIIDVRNNGGGSLRNAERLASGFVEEETEYARERIKNGPGIADFSPWESKSFAPKEGLKYNGPVVVLTNRRSYSATTFFAQMMKVIPNVTLMGDQTGGGGGTPVFAELPNGWTYRFSGTQTIDLEGNQLEDGVAVGIRVDMNRQVEIRGRDSIIERALNYINNL